MIAEVSATGTQYDYTDGLGSPVARSGAVLSRTRYEPYGLAANGDVPKIGFTGHVNDSDTGLVYMQQRYYDPIAGRMLSIDPVMTDANTGASFNRYAYAGNNPYKYIDPDGRNLVLGLVTGGAVLMVGGYKYATDPKARAVINRIFASIMSGSGKNPSVGSDTGCIYCVTGGKTTTGKDYIGSTDDLDRRSRDSSDGRDRRGADVIDTYAVGDKEERRRKEQQAINDKGGKSETDNRRNEIREADWAKNGVKPPESKEPPPKPPEPKSST